MPCGHFILIVIVIIALMLIYKELFKNPKISKMLFRMGFIKLLYFVYFQRLFDV